ncbi:MAG: hypothetical protein COA96_06505 [SAR86 cluster bacterium]|uniref:Uncharacterized protein n=1 Tax=SAR86 cluster bacterium TaxID=2030880 RepID=A0A2A5B2V2_9GAMM|nr:MAG: hypothetical protein COA96_06505 [SAR86 cluster bacterium]
MPIFSKAFLFSSGLIFAISAAVSIPSVTHASETYISLSERHLSQYQGRENAIEGYEILLAQSDHRYRANRNRNHRNSRTHSYDQRHQNHATSSYADRQRHSYNQSSRRDFSMHSFTSQPLRGGSSRRTRIIENPYSNRMVTGITLTGIDNEVVHIKNVIAYPERQLVSPLGYSLSAHHRERFINTRAYIDYISVQAKRKEYFTVTFHYN